MFTFGGRGMVLPRGIGLVRVASPLGVVVLTSATLTRHEEETARVAATALGLSGLSVVILSMAQITRLMELA